MIFTTSFIVVLEVGCQTKQKLGEQEEMYEFIENIGKGREYVQLGKFVELHKMFSNLFR